MVANLLILIPRSPHSSSMRLRTAVTVCIRFTHIYDKQPMTKYSLYVLRLGSLNTSDVSRDRIRRCLYIYIVSQIQSWSKVLLPEG